MKLLTFEDGEIHLGGKLVPGIFISLSVSGRVRFDEKKIDGQSGKRKIPQGFEDCDIVAVLTLLTDATTCYEKLAILSGMFRQVGADANPVVLDVTNPHITARGIRQVVFSRLDSSENTETDEIQASIGFVEHNPPIIRVEKSASQTKTPSEVGAETTAQPPVDSLIVDGN